MTHIDDWGDGYRNPINDPAYREPRDIVSHVHNQGHRQEYRHVHAWGSRRHGHYARAVCNHEDCAGFPTHNIHPIGPPAQISVYDHNVDCLCPECEVS